MLVRHVASMASGHETETVDAAYATDPAEPVRGFLLQPPDRDPGTVFAYNQPCTYTLAAIVQRETGRSLTDWLRPRLLDPLGIGEAPWQRDRTGRLGFSGLHATTDAIARLGLLYAGDGMWDGKRLLPEGWVARASRPHLPTAGAMGETGRQDWDLGYGFQFWMSRRDGFRGRRGVRTVLPRSARARRRDRHDGGHRADAAVPGPGLAASRTGLPPRPAHRAGRRGPGPRGASGPASPCRRP
ncbi:hypothetical protein SHIRM173S_10414 [Streptomyces hirsutus]